MSAPRGGRSGAGAPVHGGRSVRCLPCRGSSTASRGRSPASPPRRSRPTAVTSVPSSPGPSGSGPTGPAPSTARPCGATSPTSPPAAMPGAPSPGGRQPCGATSAGCDAPGRSRPTPPWASAPPGRRAPAPGVAPRRAARPARRSVGHRGRRRGRARGLRDDAVLEVLYGSGLRVAELCALDVGDVDIARRRLTVWGKGSKQRAVPLGEPAADGRRALAPRRSRGVRHRGHTRRRRLPQRPGAAPHAPRRPPHRRPPLAVADPPARPAPHLRDPPARRRRRPPCRAGTARAFRPGDHTALHSRLQGTASRCVQ